MVSDRDLTLQFLVSSFSTVHIILYKYCLRHRIKQQMEILLFKTNDNQLQKRRT